MPGRLSNAGLAGRAVVTGVLLASLVDMAAAQAQPSGQGIYTCTDARGRKLTSDRPIPECSDREQRLLNPSGTLKARIAPPLTAQERANLEAKDKVEQEELTRRTEEKRRERALLVRYPNQAVHDQERNAALGQFAAVRQAAISRVDELLRQHVNLSKELEFYKNDPSKAPPYLLRQVDGVTQSLTAQGHFIAEQDVELKRVDTRFDEELTRLTPLWAIPAYTSATDRRAR